MGAKKKKKKKNTQPPGKRAGLERCGARAVQSRVLGLYQRSMDRYASIVFAKEMQEQGLPVGDKYVDT